MPEQPSSAREAVTDYVLSQLLGPTSRERYLGIPLPSCNDDGVVHLRQEEITGPFYDPESGFPLCQNIRPEMVFGTGVLHSPEHNSDVSVPVNEIEIDVIPVKEEPFSVPTVPDVKGRAVDSAEVESFGLDKSQKIRPNAMGFTAQFQCSDQTIFTVNIEASIYVPVEVKIDGKYRQIWWKRNPYLLEIPILWQELKEFSNTLFSPPLSGPLENYADLNLRWREISPASQNEPAVRALTIVLKHKGIRPDDLFQVSLKCELSEGGKFLSTDSAPNKAEKNLEDLETDFLYRHKKTYAVGHGVSVQWDDDPTEHITKISTVSVPVFFQEVLSTEIQGVQLEMLQLGRSDVLEIRTSLEGLLEAYAEWISSHEDRLQFLPEHEKQAAESLVQKTKHILSRMRAGLEILFDPERPQILEAFRLTNEAMYLQQRNGRIARREFSDNKGQPLMYKELKLPTSGFGTWRPFQMGFILMVLPGLVDPLHETRDEVDLIFFPTGGGKTEAYLGAAAITILYQRLIDPEHSGVDVLMRYTLRLLTIQQFERSAGLITALEFLRRKDTERLGVTPISIGVWLGSDTTPNTRDKAVATLQNAHSNLDEATNPFIISKCPWCGAAFGFRKSTKSWIGYRKSITSPATLIFKCEDASCAFYVAEKPLPIWITDEDVYAYRPSFILGTVDKFARLTWEPRARAIFNIDDAGNKAGRPPSLIIQDELHLISGPLGSMVALYETAIQELCTYESDGHRIRPKIIASTATTKRYSEQISAIYNRENVTMFPQALDTSNETFFSSIDRDEDGQKRKGTAYLGINPATYATGQLSASQMAAFLSQAPTVWTGDPQEMDFYSTSVWFFNSLKELGQTLTLMQTTVVSLLNSMWRQRRLPAHSAYRGIEPVMELTSRVTSSAVKQALDDLNVPASDKGSVRTCLASSIMEVGVDVQRLGLLTIMGQPKLTSQYIQVSGRVGRAGARGPGLVIVLYNASRSRDRSVYEHFPSFHSKLYSQVEPLSVTPFALQTMEKGLVGAFLALYRMLGPIDLSANTIDVDHFSRVDEIFRARIATQPNSEIKLADYEAIIENLRDRWTRYRPATWAYSWIQEHGSATDLQTALMRGRPEPLSHIPGDMSLLVPNSLRDVDGQTNLGVESNVYSFINHNEVVGEVS